jgi:hypothetical protein
MTTVQKEKLPRLDVYFWAGALIFAGLVFGADSMGILPQIGEANQWSWVFLGAGILGFVLNYLSQSSPEYSNPTSWDWGWSIVFFIIGIAGFISFTVPGWLFLIAIGVVILLSAFQLRE